MNLEQITQVVKDAGTKILSYYGHTGSMSKKDGSPVTIADLEANRILMEGIKDIYPDDDILSEEVPDDPRRLTKERVWIIDPLDGTEDFIEQTDDFGVLVGLSVRGRAEAAVIYAPISQKLYTAVLGNGAFLTTPSGVSQLRVSDKIRVEDMVLVMNRLYKNIDDMTRYFPVKNSRKAGSAGMRVCKIAEKVADIHVSLSGKEWDYCGAGLILSEAGGQMTDLEGNPLIWNQQDPERKIVRVASNGKVHDRVLDYTRKYVKSKTK